MVCCNQLYQRGKFSKSVSFRHFRRQTGYQNRFETEWHWLGDSQVPLKECPWYQSNKGREFLSFYSQTTAHLCVHYDLYQLRLGQRLSPLRCLVCACSSHSTSKIGRFSRGCSPAQLIFGIPDRAMTHCSGSGIRKGAELDVVLSGTCARRACRVTSEAWGW